MNVNEFFEEIGTAETIEDRLYESVTYNKVNADLLFSIIHDNRELLSGDEFLIDRFVDINKDGKDKKDSAAILGLMIVHQKYHINVKYTTLALICLLFDIVISKGFASFLFGMFGLDYSIVKLDKMEKCIAYKLKEKKALSLDELKESCQCTFTYNNSKCGKLNDDGTCTIWGKDQIIDNALESMIEKKIIKIKGEKYVLVL